MDKTAKITCIGMWAQMHFLDLQSLCVFRTAGVTTDTENFSIFPSETRILPGLSQDFSLYLLLCGVVSQLTITIQDNSILSSH